MSMKVLTLMIFTSFLLACDSGSKKIIKEGIWLGYGYTCISPEGIYITHERNRVVAIKISGDNCIPKYDTTWIASYDNGSLSGYIKGANPSLNHIQYDSMEIEVISMDSLVLRVNGTEEILTYKWESNGIDIPI
jgi:hypothetical protein